MSLEEGSIQGPAGPLELLQALPSSIEPSKPPLLFVHGSFCSAHDYMFFLPYLARHGFPAYAVSLRGHGASSTQGWFDRMVLTSLDSWAEDVLSALDHIAAAHPDRPPAVLGGHSLGGGLVQYIVSEGLLVSDSDANPEKAPAAGYQGIKSQVSGLILLAAAPLTGDGKEIMANWEQVEAPNGYAWPWSERCLLNTVDQVRAAFFGPKTSQSTIETWLDKCKTAEESARAGLSVLSKFGDADVVSERLQGIRTLSGARRKVLCVASTADKLVTSKMVADNAVEYELVAGDENEGCLSLVIEGSGHHLMMDTPWESCAQGVVNWLNGDEL